MRIIKLRGTWNGRPGVAENYLLKDNPKGLRINVVRWQDRDEADVRLIEGDGRTARFKEHRHVTVPHRDADKIVREWVRELMQK